MSCCSACAKKDRNVGILNQLCAAADAKGREASQIVDVAVYGTRRSPEVNAGTDLNRGSASGRGLQSVYQGPLQLSRGAPLVKRARQA